MTTGVRSPHMLLPTGDRTPAAALGLPPRRGPQGAGAATSTRSVLAHAPPCTCPCPCPCHPFERRPASRPASSAASSRPSSPRCASSCRSSRAARKRSRPISSCGRRWPMARSPGPSTAPTRPPRAPRTAIPPSHVSKSACAAGSSCLRCSSRRSWRSLQTEVLAGAVRGVSQRPREGPRR